LKYQCNVGIFQTDFDKWKLSKKVWRMTLKKYIFTQNLNFQTFDMTKIRKIRWLIDCSSHYKIQFKTKWCFIILSDSLLFIFVMDVGTFQNTNELLIAS
jgi:hypothetical protein